MLPLFYQRHKTAHIFCDRLATSFFRPSRFSRNPCAHRTCRACAVINGYYGRSGVRSFLLLVATIQLGLSFCLSLNLKHWLSGGGEEQNCALLLRHFFVRAARRLCLVSSACRLRLRPRLPFQLQVSVVPRHEHATRRAAYGRPVSQLLYPTRLARLARLL